MNHIKSTLCILLALLSARSPAPIDQPITAVNFYDTLRGMAAAARGEPGTFILTNGRI